MISDELSNVLFGFSLHLGAELQGGGVLTTPPPSGGGKSRGPSGRGSKNTSQKLKTGTGEAILFDDFVPLGDTGAIFKYKVAILESFSCADAAAVVWTSTIEGSDAFAKRSQHSRCLVAPLGLVIKGTKMIYRRDCRMNGILGTERHSWGQHSKVTAT